ncbi:MAG: serine/threonine-protein kinase [Myxococcota bacterium]
MADARTAPGGDEEGGPDRRLGRVLGGLYRLDARIGEGGMGAVYRATHVHLGKAFAVKVLSAEVRPSERAVERLRREAITASRIAHDHIVDVVSFDHADDGGVFIVMELVEGRDLADLLATGRLPVERAVRIARQIAAALGAAHANGVVHRDLKPENVLVTEKHGDDFVKVLDFGISTVKTADAERVRVTRTGQLVGTPLYMSPEQARGDDDVDHRADVYALGCILYEMLTGHPPFEGTNYFQLLWKHGNRDPEPPSERCPAADIPPALEAVALRALAKDPADRFDSMEAFDAALGEAVAAGTAGGTVDRASHGRGRRRRVWIGAAVAAAVIGAFAWVQADRDVPTEDSESGTTTGDGAGSEAATATGAGAGTEAATATETGAGTATANATGTATAAGAGSEVATEEKAGTVSVRFESWPVGARVHAGDAYLGETPLVAPLPARDGPIRVRFSLRGYRDAWVQVVPNEGARVRARLEPRTKAGRERRTLPMKREL